MLQHPRTGISLALILPLTFPFAAVYSQATPAKAGASEYALVRAIPVDGDEGWDYLAVDTAARLIYVSHGSRVVVLDADSGGVLGNIPDTQGVHGIAIASGLGRGFTSNGRTNTVTVFDLKTLAKIGAVKTGTNPDAIVYDAGTKRVFTMNGGSNDLTGFNAADDSIVGTLALGGKPEFAVADGQGSVFVNIEDKSELVQFDPQRLTEIHRWPLAPCQEPSGLALDLKARRLFVGCRNKMMAVVDADTGKIIATPTIGEGVDANAFDPATNFAFASNGEGTLTVVHEDSPDKFTEIDTVPTRRSARTMALDLKTHSIFLPAAEFEPPAPGERRGKMKPGSFVVLLFKK